MSSDHRTRLTAPRWVDRISPLLPLLAFPIRALAQTTGDASATPAPASSTAADAIAVVVMVMVALLAIGIGVKLYDRKRQREGEILSLQAYISNALVLDASLAGLPISVFASGSLWRRSPVVIAVSGPVPTPEVRDAVMRLVERELSRRHPGARVEDRVVVDPRRGIHVI